MKKPKRPEVKMPEIKTPAFVADLYYDLRDRRLLPLVALVVVAIAAVPFLLGGKSEEAFVAPSGAPLSTLGSSSSSKLTVVEATPGLRDYRKRLAERSPTNPFTQRYTGLPKSAQVKAEAGAGEGSSASVSSNATETTASSEATVEGTGGSSGGSGGSSQGGGSGGGTSGEVDPNAPGLHFFGLRPDVRFGFDGSGQLTSYPEMSIGQALPKQNPVVVFLGVSEDGKRAAFHVSDEIVLVRGEGDCTGGRENCDLLFLREGEAVDLRTGMLNRAFRLAVDRIDFVEVDPPKAAHTSTAQRHRDYGFSQSFIK